MQLAVTFRHMDATSALKEYSKEKVERINKYFPDPIKAHVVLSCDRGFNHVADVIITLHNGFVIKGQETTEDMYSSIDLVMAKIERQVRRYKEKLQHHRSEAREFRSREVQHSVVSMPEAQHAAGNGSPAIPEARPATSPAMQFQVVRKDKFIAASLSVEEAIMQLNLNHNEFLVFTNALSKDVNVVYRRKDGTYGLIDTGGASQQQQA